MMRSQRPSSRRRLRALILSSVAVSPLLSFTPEATAAPNTWLGTFGPIWDTFPNWSTGAKPSAADDAIFPAFSPPGFMLLLGPGELAKSLAFHGPYSLSGGSLTVTSG